MLTRRCGVDLERRTADEAARVVAARRALLDRGYMSLAEAARAGELDYTTLTKVVRFGLPRNPRVRTIEGLRRLGIFELIAAH
jgi:hypothetical protein